MIFIKNSVRTSDVTAFKIYTYMYDIYMYYLYYLIFDKYKIMWLLRFYPTNKQKNQKFLEYSLLSISSSILNSLFYPSVDPSPICHIFFILSLSIYFLMKLPSWFLCTSWFLRLFNVIYSQMKIWNHRSIRTWSICWPWSVTSIHNLF